MLLCGQFQIEIQDSQNEGSGILYRLEQVGKPKNRLLVVVRNIESIPVHQVIEQVLVAQPTDLICQRVVSMTNHPGTPRELLELSDIYRLLLAFPELKSWKGKVTDRLRESGAPDFVLDAWREIVDTKIEAEDERAGF